MNRSYAVSWSGGKDSALALYKAQSEGMNISYLFTMFTPDGFTGAHRVPREIIQKQAEAIGIPLVEGVATWGTYEQEFKSRLSALKEKGVIGCIFGDIDLDEHIEWCRRVCDDVGLQAVHPLFGNTQEQLLKEFVAEGFETIIVVVKQGKLGTEYLGRKLDVELIEEISALEISASGEFGEYHTLVVDGPIFRTSFKENLQRLKTSITTSDGYAFWTLTAD
ncbi:MAG: diphthine--ammonia ligase [Syntrophomonadaceae bacterium]|nr:diphthine--ammonia ligase [Syntrophomonadaceae bacterium]